MVRMLKNPRYSVLSIRLSDDELKEIESLAKDSGASRSEYARAMLQSVLNWRNK